MRRLPIVLFLVTFASPLGTAAGGDRHGGLVRVPGKVSTLVPPGWHLVHGWLSDVTDPAPRLAVGSFPVRLSRQTCACGSPNVIHFPRNGAFVFVWEYLHPSPRMLAAVPRRPSGFRLPAGKPQRFRCQGPSDSFNFADRDRYFQVEVYLGPAVSSVTRARTMRILQSLRA
jgi:hypothetical protein